MGGNSAVTLIKGWERGNRVEWGEPGSGDRRQRVEVGQSIGIGSEGGPMVFTHMGNKTGSESASAESSNHILETTAATDKIASSVTIKRFVFDKGTENFYCKICARCLALFYCSTTLIYSDHLHASSSTVVQGPLAGKNKSRYELILMNQQLLIA